MQGSKSLESLEEKEQFAEVMADPDRMGLSVKEIAEKFGCSVATIYNRMRDPEIAKMIKKMRAERVKVELPKVDNALIEKAKKGDVRACQLIYEKWDDFTPKHKQELSGHIASSEEEALSLENKQKIRDLVKRVVEGNRMLVSPEPEHKI